ncbi:MAG: hypothetical protein EOP45_19635, partial [Sphingobacteriaceae bacterium]
MFAHQYWIKSKTTQIRRVLYMPADGNEYIYKEMDVTLIPHQRVFSIEDTYLLYTNHQYAIPARNITCRKLGFRLAFGDTYKWMLYGDDDTMFFAEGIQNLVKDIDPNMPYFITGKV